MLNNVVSRLLPSNLRRSPAADIADVVFGVPVRKLGDWPVVVEMLALAGCALSTALASTVGALVCFLVSLLADAYVSRTAGRLDVVLELDGWGNPLRALFRWAVFLPALGTTWYVVMPVAVQVAWLVSLLGVLWVQQVPPMLRFVADGPQPVATMRCARLFRRVARVPVTFVVLEAAAALAMFEFVLPVRVVTVCAAVIVVDGLATLTSALRLSRSRHHDEDELHAGVEATNPVVAVYVSTETGDAGQRLGQWIGTFTALPTRPLVIVRQASQLAAVLGVSGDPAGDDAPDGEADEVPTVVWAPSARQVETLCSWGVQVVFCLWTEPGNADVWNVAGVTSVFLEPDDSDEASSVSPLARVYDEIWVAGPAAIERYRQTGVELPDERFVIIGLPSAEQLPAGSPSGAVQTFVDQTARLASGRR